MIHILVILKLKNCIHVFLQEYISQVLLGKTLNCVLLSPDGESRFIKNILFLIFESFFVVVFFFFFSHSKNNYRWQE